MEEIVRSFALHVSLVVEALATLVIATGLIQLLVRYIPTRLSKKHHLDTKTIRIKFGASLTLSLELLLAADILQTAVAPTWEDIGKLAAIAAIRTILNYFLEKELASMENNKQESSG